MTKNTLDTCYSIDDIFLYICMNFSHIKQSIIVATIIIKIHNEKMGKSIIFPFAIVGRSFMIWYNFFKVENAFATEQFIFEFIHWN